MSDTKIEWAEQVWNPIVGCSLESPGCTNCYAMKMAWRLQAMTEAGNAGLDHYSGTTKMVNGKAVWTGKLGLSETALLAPLRRKKPTTYFVNSMGDLFHPDVPDEWIDRVFAVMALCSQHTFQVLTKRSARMRDYVNACAFSSEWILSAVNFKDAGKLRPNRSIQIKFPLPNVWLGVSAEDQIRADQRIPDLLATPAAVRFISAEPLLGPVNLRDVSIGKRTNGFRINALTGQAYDDLGEWASLPKLDQVIVGGESGPGARPMHPDWARSLRDQCAAAAVPFFFKQWGEWMPTTYEEDAGEDFGSRFLDGSDRWAEKPSGPWQSCQRGKAGVDSFYKAGKKAAGRLLDGVEHNGFPVTGEGAPE